MRSYKFWFEIFLRPVKIISHILAEPVTWLGWKRKVSDGNCLAIRKQKMAWVAYIKSEWDPSLLENSGEKPDNLIAKSASLASRPWRPPWSDVNSWNIMEYDMLSLIEESGYYTTAVVMQICNMCAWFPFGHDPWEVCVHDI